MLVHAGDLSQGGTREEIQRSLNWLNDLPHPKKVIIAGNHKLLLNPEKGLPNEERRLLSWHDLIYLQDSSISLRFPGGRLLKVYGSPWTRKHGNWAFEYPKGVDQWTNTPDDIDVFFTHMPPYSHLDIDGFGDDSLLREVRRVPPRLHVLGHFHAGYGRDELHHDSFEMIYEAAIRGQAGFWSVLKMACSLLVWMHLTGRKQADDSTILINAAIVGGLRDTDIRAPLSVEI